MHLWLKLQAFTIQVSIATPTHRIFIKVMHTAIVELRAAKKKDAIVCSEGRFQAVLSSHEVPKYIQVAIGLRPCKNISVFSEFFKDKAAVKADAPELFRLFGMGSLKSRHMQRVRTLSGRLPARRQTHKQMLWRSRPERT